MTPDAWRPSARHFGVDIAGTFAPSAGIKRLFDAGFAAKTTQSAHVEIINMLFCPVALGDRVDMSG